MNQPELIQAAKAYLAVEEHPDFKKEVQDLLNTENYAELNERFYTTLSFGTGGLRGVIGGGTNRMNPFMVRSSTQGLANYVNKTVKNGASAVIAHDSRNFSDLFALEAALILCANGIKTYLFSKLRPTPELSFAVRHFKAATGIMVTASHNPAEYNGYKVYWNDGAQVLPPHDQGIIDEVRGVKGHFKSISKSRALEMGLLVYVDQEVDKIYLNMVKSLSLRPQLIQESGKNLRVVYTPLHGTGGTLLPGLMKDLGVNLISVESQMIPDGRFPTVVSPNPEEASAMKLALELAAQSQADLIIGTDPDADRIGIGVPHKGGYELLNGNQLGCLLTEYVFSSLKTLNKLPPKPAFINTIVTTDLQNIIAKSYGAQTFKTLTGFKYIGEKIRQFDADPLGPQYIIGGEESYGFLYGTQVRDKDAISAASLTIEMALYYQSQGQSVMEALHNIYRKYGYFKEILISKTFKGQAGVEKMKGFMENLRKTPPSSIGSLSIKAVSDYISGTTKDLATGIVTKIQDIAASDVVQFILSDGSLVSVRPSGTEPKIKFYASCRAQEGLDVDKALPIVDRKLQEINDVLDQWIN